MYHFCYPILIAEYITVTDHRDTNMLFEIIDTSEICSTSECLFVGATMYRDEARTRTFESLHKIDEKIWILPTKTSLDRYWYLDRLAHLFDYLECSITVDHQR